MPHPVAEVYPVADQSKGSERVVSDFHKPITAQTAKHEYSLTAATFEQTKTSFHTLLSLCS